MTGGQSNLFNENEEKSQQTSENLNTSTSASWPDLSICYASENEFQEHANYFAKFN